MRTYEYKVWPWGTKWKYQARALEDGLVVKEYNPFIMSYKKEKEAQAAALDHISTWKMYESANLAQETTDWIEVP